MAMNHHDPSRNIFDDYDSLKAYYKLLAMPGRHFQAREFNVVQSMLLDLIKRLGNTIFKDGNIVEGCAVTVNGTVVTIAPGKIYYDGVIFDTEGAVLEITASGMEIIGVKIEEVIVDYDTDDSLLDPAVGNSSYLHPGCKRVKKQLIFTVNDNLSATLVRINDGQIQQLVMDTPVMDTMEEVLARRTFDESGNYIVKGFELKDAEYSTQDKILVGLSKGKAYIKGYEVQRPTDTSFEVNKALTSRVVEAETKLATTYSNSFTLFNNPVKSVNRVLITVETTEVVNRGAVSGTSDALSRNPVLSVVEVKQSTTTYVPGIDFTVSNNRIDWSLGGNEPVTGTNYTVVYRYKDVIDEGTHYTVSSDGVVTTVELQTGLAAIGTEIEIDYEYYLARKDTIALDKDGNVVVIEGVPDDISLTVAPLVTDNTILKIGYVTVMPNSDKITFSNDTVRVSSMERIQKTVKRVDDIEYNLAITDLDNEAMEGESATELRGVFTDGFLNFNKLDLTYEGANVSFDIVDGTMNLPAEESLTSLAIGNFPENNYATLGNVLCCPYAETLAFEQPYCTETMLVNPYQVFDRLVNILIDPAVDNWIDEEKITVESNTAVRETVRSTKLNKWWNGTYRPSNSELAQWIEWGFVNPDGTKNTSTRFSSGFNNISGGTISVESIKGSSTETVLDEAVTYMRQQTVKIFSDTFVPEEDNIYCKFGGRVVPLTPLNTTLAGTEEGTVKADRNGKLEASFKIPKNVPCGTVEVEVYSLRCHGSAEYSAEGRHIVIRETIFKESTVVRVTDPLAQTFQLDDTCYITGLDVYFAVKDGNIPCRVQLRNSVNGYPGTTLYAETIIKGEDIVISEDGSLPTRVTFPNVVKCEKDTQYSFVIMTDSDIMSVFVAKLGGLDLITGEFINRNPFTAGVLFSSSNSLTWTAHQDMDMKFKLYRAQFETNGYFQYNSIAPNNADRLMIALEHVQPVGTEVYFEGSINGGAWMPLLPWVDRDLDVNASRLDVRVRMISNGKESPLVNIDTAKVASWRSSTDACYVSRTIELPEGYNDIKVYFDSTITAGTTFKAYYALDDIASVWYEMGNPEVTQLSESWQQNYYHVVLDQDNTTFRVKVEMTCNTPNKKPKIKRLMNILRML